jgi:hypothetical protein
MRECRSKPKKEHSHVAQDEEEASLMLVTVTLIHPKAGWTEAGGSTAPAREIRLLGESFARTLAKGSTAEVISSSSEVQIHEKVFAHLDEEKERDVRTWVLNTGATNHMSGCWKSFRKIKTTVLNTVRFGHDLVARIEGRGTIMFVCKNGESHSFDGVYFIPHLTTNIVSISQLDEIGYKIDINTDTMKI